MDEFIHLSIQGEHIELAAHPVTRYAYRTYLTACHMPIPPFMSHGDGPASPVTYVSQTGAVAYCDWLSAREGRRYRLPTMHELVELAAGAVHEVPGAEIWPHLHGNRPELRGGLKEVFLCEWTNETEMLTQFDAARAPRLLATVFYPPWLREGSNASHVQAELLATEGYSFITFRVVRDGLRS